MIDQFGLSFGSSIFAKSANESKEVRKALLSEGIKAFWNPGGSLLNALRTMASLGDSIFLCTVIGKDKKGKKMSDRLEALGMHILGVKDAPSEEPFTLNEHQRTGRVMCCITKNSNGDVERTMQTFLGITSSMTPEHVREEYFKDQEWAFIEGYNCYHQGVLQKCFDVAVNNKCKIVLNLPTPDHLGRHRAAFNEHAPKVHYLFGNIKEFQVLTGMDQPEEVAKTFREDQEIIMTNGEHGCLVKEAGTRDVRPFPAIHVPKELIVDPTAAGDTFLAGYMHAVGMGKSLEERVLRASTAASLIIQNIGTEFTPDQLHQLKAL
jgi:sugar/nucleoside kinase (ribokinase family)